LLLLHLAFCAPAADVARSGGLLVVAKSASALASLSGQFEGRRVHKVYHALLAGRLEPAAVTAAIAHARQQQQQESSDQALPNTEAPSSDDDSDDTSPAEADFTTAHMPEHEVHEQAAATDMQWQQQQQQQQEMSLQELLQLQLQSQPAFSVSAADLGDPSLVPAIHKDHGDGSSSSSSNLSLSPDVHVVDLPLNGKACYSLLQVSSFVQGWCQFLQNCSVASLHRQPHQQQSSRRP
jgi:hypothetical protein